MHLTALLCVLAHPKSGTLSTGALALFLLLGPMPSLGAWKPHFRVKSGHVQLSFVHSPSYGQKGGVAFGSHGLYSLLRGQNPGPPHSICNFVDLGIKLDYLNPREEDLEEDLGNRISPVIPPTKQKKRFHWNVPTLLTNNLTTACWLLNSSVKYLLVVMHPMAFIPQQALQLKVKSRITSDHCFIVTFHIILLRIKCHISVLLGTKKREEMKSLRLHSDNTHT